MMFFAILDHKTTSFLQGGLLMPYQIHWEQNCVVVDFTGVFDYEESREVGDELYASPNKDSLEYVIWNLSRAETLDFSEEIVKGQALRDKLGSHLMAKIKMGFVVTDESVAELCIQYIMDSSVYDSPWEFKVAGSLEAIREWISD